MIEAIAWKWPGLQVSIRGKQIYSNIEIHELNTVPVPTESEISQAIIEYSAYLRNEALNGKKVEEGKRLRDKEIDKLIESKITKIKEAKK